MKFIESFYDNYTFLYIMGGICCIGVLMKCSLLYGYVRLIRASESMATTNTNWMKNMKLRFETSYQLKIGVNNVDIFVDKHVNRSKFCGILLSTWENLSGQTITLCLVTGTFAGISGLVYHCGAGRVLFTFFVGAWTAIIVNIVDNVVNIPAHKQLLRLNLKDYFENYLKVRMEQEHLNAEIRKQTRREYLYEMNSATSLTAATLQDSEPAKRLTEAKWEVEETLLATPVKLANPKPVVVKQALSKNTSFTAETEKKSEIKEQKSQLKLLKTMELEREKELKEEKKRLEALSKESAKEKKKEDKKKVRFEKKNEKLILKEAFKQEKLQKKEELEQAKLQAYHEERQEKLAKKEEKEQEKLNKKQAKIDAKLAKKEQKEKQQEMKQQALLVKQQDKEEKKQANINQKAAIKQEKTNRKEENRLAKIKAKEDAKISKYIHKQEKIKAKESKLQEKIARASNPNAGIKRKEEKSNASKISQKAYKEKMRLKEEKQRNQAQLEEEKKLKAFNSASKQTETNYEAAQDIIDELVKQKAEDRVALKQFMEKANEARQEAGDCIATSKEDDELIEEVLREFFM